MRFYKNLYVSKWLTERKDIIVEKLKSRKYPLSTYILVLSRDGENQMEFFSTALLYQNMMPDEDIYVVGIAAGYRDAICMVKEIAEEVYQQTGDLDIARYIRLHADEV